jgi:hypothetical protein
MCDKSSRVRTRYLDRGQEECNVFTMRHNDSEGITRADTAPIHIARDNDEDSSKAVGCRSCQKAWSKRTGLPYPQPAWHA